MAILDISVRFQGGYTSYTTQVNLEVYKSARKYGTCATAQSTRTLALSVPSWSWESIPRLMILVGQLGNQFLEEPKNSQQI